MTEYLANASTVTLDYVEKAWGEGNAPVVTGSKSLHEIAGAAVAVWEAKEGTIVGIPKDEVFVVLSGSATITLASGAQTMDIGPGDVVRLIAGVEVRWDVHEVLRKMSVVVRDA